MSAPPYRTGPQQEQRDCKLVSVLPARLNQFWETWEALGAGPKVVHMLKEGYTQPFQTRLNLTRSPTIISFLSSQEPLPVGGISSADKQKCSRVGQKSRISGFLQPAVLLPKTKQQMETYTRSEQSQQIPQGRKILNGDTRNDPDLPTDKGVSAVHRLQGCLLPYTHTKLIKKISEISCTGQNIPFQSTTIWLVHSSLGVFVVTKEVTMMALQKGIRIHYYRDDWFVWVRSHQTYLQHTQRLVALCEDLGWLVNMEKSELNPKQVFDFIGYQFDLKEGKVRPTLAW